MTDSLPVNILNHLLPNRLVNAGTMSGLVLSAMRLAESRITPHSREAEGCRKNQDRAGVDVLPDRPSSEAFSTSHGRTASELLASCNRNLYTDSIYTFVECLN